MSIRAIVVGMALVCTLASAGCSIEHCERGAVCDHDDREDEAEDRRDLCVGYCARLSVWGGRQADDFDGCVEACEERFEELPRATRELCECAEQSRCSDVIEGRCSAPGSSPDPAAGGACALPGSSCGAGGSATAGAPPAGGSSGGGTAGGGGSAGADPGVAGADNGGSSGAPGNACTAACDCAAGENCIDGYCVAG